MGTCCGKPEKKARLENGSFPEALDNDEAKPLRPLRDAAVKQKKAKSLEHLEADKKTQEETPKIVYSKSESEVAAEKSSETTINANLENSEIAQVTKSIQNSKQIEEEPKNVTNETQSKSCSLESNSTNQETRLNVVPEETSRNAISEDQEPSANSICKKECLDESNLEETGNASVHKQIIEENPSSASNDPVLQEVFSLDLSSVEKAKLEAEGIQAEENTSKSEPEEQYYSAASSFDKATDSSNIESDLKALLTPDLLKKLHEETDGTNGAGDFQNDKQPEETPTVFPLNLSGAEKSGIVSKNQNTKPGLLDRAESDKETALPENGTERTTRPSKIESDLEALLTPDLLKKLSEKQVGTTDSGDFQKANVTNGKTEDNALVSSSGQVNRPASSTRLSQQEQRHSRNSFLGNFLQEGVFSSFDDQFNSMTETVHNPVKKIEDIIKSTRNLQRQVEAFCDGKTSTEYLYLESSLLINIDELNKIEDETAEKAEALSKVYEVLKKLDENSVF